MEHYQLEVDVTERDDERICQTIALDGIVDIYEENSAPDGDKTNILDFVLLGTVLILTCVIVLALSIASDYYNAENVGYGSVSDFFAVYGILNIFISIPLVKSTFIRIFFCYGSTGNYFIMSIVDVFAALIITGILNCAGKDIQYENIISAVCMFVVIFKNKKVILREK